MTTRNEEYTCPFCENKFNFETEFSHSQFGVFLDYKPHSFMAVPGFLPKCPKCSFVFFPYLFNEEEIKQIKSLFNDNNIFVKEPGMPNYYYLAKICEVLNKDIDDIIYFYHSAIWEDKSYFDFISDIMINYFENIDTINKNYYVYKIIKLDFLRRKGETEIAMELLIEINNDSNFPLTKELKTLLRYQFVLINRNDINEHIWPENKEDIEKRIKFNNFLEAASISILVACNSVSKSVLEELHKVTLLNKSFIYQKIKNNLPLIESSLNEGYYILKKLKNVDVEISLLINFNGDVTSFRLKDIRNETFYDWECFQKFIYSKYDTADDNLTEIN